jgi:gamma-glutamylcyclotransferase (GGCT)/AIG2-like uncharacterized protein YtfP
VAEETLPALDAFEDCPVLYRRELIELADGQRVYAYLSSRGL